MENKLGALRTGEFPVAGEPARWTADHLRDLSPTSINYAPVIGGDDFARVGDDIDIWDAWPVQDATGEPVVFAQGITLWMALGSPHFDDPDERHSHARIHLFQREGNDWLHLGQVMPEGFSPGSREWSGSAVLEPDGRRLTLYFTAAGVRGEAALGFLQRLFLAEARLQGGPGTYKFVEWGGLREIVERDPAYYMASDSGGCGPGKIKAFRDPAYFRDPNSGLHYAFFAGSHAGSASAYNGVIGAAVAPADNVADWKILPPLIDADGLNNELERPHVILHAGKYYLFWSTQTHVFDPEGPMGPTGLYGMVADSLEGDWQPLNGTGLVFANPPEAPAQAYSWLVLPDLGVISFVDNWGQLPGTGPVRFGASFAPEIRLALDGAIATIAG